MGRFILYTTGRSDGWPLLFALPGLTVGDGLVLVVNVLGHGQGGTDVRKDGAE